VPEHILRIIDVIAVILFVVVGVAIPVFAVVSVTIAVKKWRDAPKSARRPLRIRIRIWQLMTAVLVVGVVLELGLLTRRALDARQKAEEHASQAQFCRFMLGREKLDLFFIKMQSHSLDFAPGLRDYYESLERHHEELERKYRDIARHPWRFASEDAPAPTMPEGLAILGPEYLVLVKEMEKSRDIMARSVAIMDSQ
jgi:hypothetical protein